MLGDVERKAFVHAQNASRSLTVLHWDQVKVVGRVRCKFCPMAWLAFLGEVDFAFLKPKPTNVIQGHATLWIVSSEWEVKLLKWWYFSTRYLLIHKLPYLSQPAHPANKLKELTRKNNSYWVLQHPARAALLFAWSSIPALNHLQAFLVRTFWRMPKSF